tara:strand:- start:1479 stop:2702 length:1224 start_codon:yes stop_codon:yes gene_type:complete
MNLGTVLVTGGAGFLGSHLVEALLNLGSKQVNHIHCVDVVPYKNPSSDSSLRNRLTSHVVDLRNVNAIKKLINETQPTVIFHLASVVDVRPIKTQAVMDINVGGTANLLLAASSCSSTKAFVYCSSLDVVYSGYPMDYISETAPYTNANSFRWWVPGNYYCVSKARAEEMVLAANSNDEQGDRLKTCALRPGHLFGERDAILDFFVRLPCTVSTSGGMSMQYIGNTAAIHILAARALLARDKNVMGEAFNMADRDISFSQFYGKILQPTHAAHKPPMLLPIPYLFLFFIGLTFDFFDFLLNILGQFLTPFLMCCRIRKRGNPLLLRFPRHPALCLCSASALESSEHHRTNLTKGHKTFHYNEMFGKTSQDNIRLYTWEESIERTRNWAQNKMINHPKHRTIGYSFQG